MKDRFWEHRHARKVFQELAETETELLEPRDAAVKLLDRFRRFARLLTPGDKSTQDDLTQEMALGALRCKLPHTRSYFVQLGVGRALNYLRWWEQPLCVPLHTITEDEEPAAPEPVESEALERCEDALQP